MIRGYFLSFVYHLAIVVALLLCNPQFGAAQSKIYWTDSGSQTISRANLDGSSVEVIINEAKKIQGIPVKYKLFFLLSVNKTYLP